MATVVGKLKHSLEYESRLVKNPVVYETGNGRRYILVKTWDGEIKRLYEGSRYSEHWTWKRLNLRDLN